MDNKDGVQMKVSLEITSLEESDFSFPNVVLGVTPESDGSVLLRIQAAGGFDVTDAGAIEVASLLTNAADAIKAELARTTREIRRDALRRGDWPKESERGVFSGTGRPPVVNTAEPVVEDPDGRSRMPFNPKPIGGQ